MTDTTNRVLSLEEVLALPEGARVWVECAAKTHRETGIYVAQEGLKVKFLVFEADHDEFLIVFDYFFRPDSGIRVWSLPQPPTQEERKSVAWGGEGRCQST